MFKNVITSFFLTSVYFVLSSGANGAVADNSDSDKFFEINDEYFLKRPPNFLFYNSAWIAARSRINDLQLLGTK